MAMRKDGSDQAATIIRSDFHPMQSHRRPLTLLSKKKSQKLSQKIENKHWRYWSFELKRFSFVCFSCHNVTNWRHRRDRTSTIRISFCSLKTKRRTNSFLFYSNLSQLLVILTLEFSRSSGQKRKHEWYPKSVVAFFSLFSRDEKKITQVPQSNINERNELPLIFKNKKPHLVVNTICRFNCQEIWFSPSLFCKKDGIGIRKKVILTKKHPTTSICFEHFDYFVGAQMKIEKAWLL